jgi:hypothetical protein
MPFSEFTTARLRNGAVRVTGPFVLAQEEQGAEVPFFHFLIVQGDVIVEGEGNQSGGGWSGTTTADPALTTGYARAFGFATLVRKGPPPGFETFAWSEEIELT